MTQRVLPWLYFTRETSCGWVEADGLVIAFRRTPTGKDASGRAGAFFVHALIWPPGAVSTDVLGRLWGADVWRHEPPPDLPRGLEPIKRLEDLGLAEERVVDEELVERCLAQALEAVASGGRVALDLPPELAVPVAAAVAGAIPARFGLVSFSSWEEAGNAARYELVGAVRAPAVPDVQAPGGPLAEHWQLAARLLRGRGETEVGVVEALAERAKDRRQFARALGAWAEIELTGLAGETVLDEAAMTFVALDPRFVARLVVQGGADALARAAIAVPVDEAFVRAARGADALEGVLERAGVRLGRLAPTEALTAVRRLEALRVVSDALVESLAGAWLGGALRALGAADATYLARLLAKAPRTAATVAAFDELADNPRATEALVGSPLPVDWRAHAAARHPDAVLPETLVRALAGDARFAPIYVAEGGEAGYAALWRALPDAPRREALRAAEHAARQVRGAAGLDLLWRVIPRLDARERLHVLERAATRDVGDADRWLGTAVDALVEVVLAVRGTHAALPLVGGRVFDVDVARASARHDAWLRIAHHVEGGYRLSSTAVGRAARVVAQLHDERDREAATELLVDLCAERAVSTWDGWYRAVRAVQAEVGEGGDAFAQRLSRAAARRGSGDRGTVAFFTVCWIARALDDKRLSTSPAKPPAAALHEHLSRGYVERLREYASENTFKRPGTRWITAVVKAADKRRKRAR